MKSPRLLPVVIFATFALLVFKGIGLIADGGYVLAGVTAVHAEGAPASPAPPAEPTMADASPTLTDTAPTLASPAPPPPAAAVPAGGDAAAAGSAATAAPPPPSNAIAATDIATPVAIAPAATAGVAAATPAPAPAAVPKAPDALPMHVDASGHLVPLTGAGGASLTDAAILQRLAERRAEIDKRQAALNMREAIVAAAEKQMVQRADALKSLEAQITALTNQRQAMQDEQFAGVVKMYEAMKPQDAASIFDGLDMTVLLRVAKAMDPRKMSPVLAKMTATRAQQLTAQLAAGDGQDAPSLSSVASADPNALPQIVGH